ncbi:response regulator [Neorhizobium sp. P12A]|uniref:response regulator n=1 Tax=Rhizobium/Agrobacterium group TaxID=227290 RepID=UPI00104F085D|nr:MULTISPECIES: response regulator [Rhizobium/Agrobacterium group]KAA0695782.1 response regulator [Neorhizobium sp. P12A]TCR70974.1 hypothetical protein EV561_1375 [Rhizobium sp. BK376]
MRILIVEDEFLIAMDVEDAVRSLGHYILGPVGTLDDAKAVGSDADVALVDVRLRDGVTGPAIADHLHERGVTVIFTTGNPEAVIDSKSAIGILPKPYDPHAVNSAIEYAVSRREGRNPAVPRGMLKLSRA